VAFARRARVARAYPGLNVRELTTAEVWVYESLIPLVVAEEAVRTGRRLPPIAFREAILAAGGTEKDVLVAEAKAKLAAADRKGDE
jgi:hypothetical protein